MATIEHVVVEDDSYHEIALVEYGTTTVERVVATIVHAAESLEMQAVGSLECAEQEEPSKGE